MKYTKPRIERLLAAHERFQDHIGNIKDAMNIRGSIESIDYISGDNLLITTRWDDRCGGWELDQHKIPLDMITAESPEAFQAKLNALREEERSKAAIRQQEEQQRAAQRQQERDLAELARLKKQYESN